jgi:RNA recognition motif-containing protein
MFTLHHADFIHPPDADSSSGFSGSAVWLRRAYSRRKMEYKLYVGNLSYDISEADLHELFMQAGAVKSVALIKDKFSGQSKGFAFVEMDNQADMQNAITMFNGKEYKNRPLTVNIARPREERRDFGGGNRRGGGGGAGGAGNFSGNRKHKAGTNRRQY